MTRKRSCPLTILSFSQLFNTIEFIFIDREVSSQVVENSVIKTFKLIDRKGEDFEERLELRKDYH